MGIEDLARKYSDDKAAAAVMRVLRRVDPQYMWVGGVADLAKYYEKYDPWGIQVIRTLHKFWSDGIVEIKKSVNLEERLAIRRILVDEGKIVEDALPIIAGPQDVPAEYRKMWQEFANSSPPGYRLTDLGRRLPIYQRISEKEYAPIPALVPIPA